MDDLSLMNTIVTVKSYRDRKTDVQVRVVEAGEK